MKTKNKKIKNELYNIFENLFGDEKECELAVEECLKALPIVKQDALFRHLTRKTHE